MSSGGRSQNSTWRRPGVSATNPPNVSGISSAWTVVCRPRWVTSPTSPVLRRSPGWSAFRSEDFPTPDGPQKTEMFPFRRSRSDSMPIPWRALTASTSYPTRR